MNPRPHRIPPSSDGAIDAFLSKPELPNDRVVRDLLATVIGLREDGTERADLKLLASALREWRDAFRVFRPYAKRRKVTVFGSARVAQSDPAARLARRFAAAIVRRGFMVITGAGDGIMGAAQRGAGRENSFGVNIRLPFEQTPNAEIRGDAKLVTFKYFFSRKLLFVKEADAIVLFPGGFGTLDEGFEVLTLLQTGKTDPIPLLLMAPPGDEYWGYWEKYVRDELAAGGMVSPDDLCLFRIVSSEKEAVDEICRFYRVYHSSRYVDGVLVLRLQEALPRAVLGELEGRFADILEGKLEVRGPFPEESDVPELDPLPRLVVPFNRRSYGRLRQLIDAVNLAPVEGTAQPASRGCGRPAPVARRSRA